MKFVVREIWVADPGTGFIGFVSKFRGLWWYLCVRNSDMDPDRAKIDFGTHLPTKTIQMVGGGLSHRALALNVILVMDIIKQHP